jgi:hypothetical protein
MPCLRSLPAHRATGLAVLPLLLLASAGCGEDDGSEAPARSASHPEIRYGPAVQAHGGMVRSYVKEEGGRLLELGVAIDESILPELPDHHAPGGIVTPDGHSIFIYEVPLPEGHGTPFDHATVDWVPAGHEPPGVYDVPHFDIHFYTISREERMAIVPSGPEFLEAAGRHPAPEYVPAGFVDPGMPPVPRMGVHWVDLSSPELAPEGATPFTRTFVYGSWDGRIVFAEPMIALSWLETRPDETIPVATAERYDPPGLWPAAYRVYFDEEAGQYRVALAELARR